MATSAIGSPVTCDESSAEKTTACSFKAPTTVLRRASIGVGALVIVRLPETRPMSYFVLLAPEQVIGYTPASLPVLAGEVQVAGTSRAVSPSTKPEYDGANDKGTAAPYGSDGDGAVTTTRGFGVDTVAT